MEDWSQWTEGRLERANAELGGETAANRVRWAYEQFGEGLVVSTSFGVQAAVMLHLVTRIHPEIPVVFIDTGYLFKETYIFAQELTQQSNLTVKKYQPAISAAEQEALYGKLWEGGAEGLEQYNFIRKVEPMNRALRELGAVGWLTGLRRVQASSRSGLEVVKRQRRVIKVHPIIDWTDKDVYEYLQLHDLPYHPLWEEGYVSVGDWHSTVKLSDGLRPEDTRFNGVKRECGLHEVSDRVDFQI